MPPLHRSNTPAPLSYTKTSSVPLPYSHLIRPFLAFSLIIFSFLLFLSLRFFGDLFFSAFLTRPSWASSLTHPYLSSNPVPDAASPPSRTSARATRSSGSHTLHRVGLPSPDIPSIHGTSAGRPRRYEVVPTPTVPIYPPVSTFHAHPQPLFGYCSIPATSALFEPVPVCTPS